jgi:hypothetical protein
MPVPGELKMPITGIAPVLSAGHVVVVLTLPEDAV